MSTESEVSASRDEKPQTSPTAGERPELYPVASKPQPAYLENLFSSRARNNNQQFEGAIHLSFIIFTLLILRSAYRQIYSRGLLLFNDAQSLLCVVTEIALIYLLDLVEAACTVVLLFLYKLFVKNYISKSVLIPLYVLWQFTFFWIFFNLKWDMTPLFGMVSLMGTIVYMMKMHSFYATNLLLHQKNGKNEKTLVDETKSKLKSIVDKESCYPNNVNLKNYAYFMFCAPSLVYETKFAHSERVRVWYVLKELCGFLFCSAGVLWITAQYILPVTTATREDDTFPRLLDDLSTVCVPSFVLWLLGFYAYFHCWLNAKSELVRYANREFYKDWWNAESIGDFWRKWNLPVHEWCLRHLYIESMYYFNTSKDVATGLVFFVSAFLHEIVVSFGFKVYKPYFFVAMLAQAPLLFLNRKMKQNSKRAGNILMWISLMLGQPLLAILYFRNWVKSHNPSSFWCR